MYGVQLGEFATQFDLIKLDALPKIAFESIPSFISRAANCFKFDSLSNKKECFSCLPGKAAV